MSPERAVAFRPAELTVPGRVDVDERARAAGWAAGWAAGSRAAAEAAARRDAEARALAARERADQHAALTHALGVLERAAVAAAARTTPVVTDVMDRLHDAVLDLAEAVLGRELADGDTSARSALARALQVQDVDVQAVRLHPADLQALHRMLDDPDAPALPPQVRLVPDAGLAPGDAVAVHPDGLIDARITTALDRARRVLRGEDL